MSNFNQLLLDLGRIHGAITLHENQEQLLTILQSPDPADQRAASFLVSLHATLTELLGRNGRITSGTHP